MLLEKKILNHFCIFKISARSLAADFLISFPETA
jgi:hypothetical protein